MACVSVEEQEGAAGGAVQRAAGAAASEGAGAGVVAGNASCSWPAGMYDDDLTDTQRAVMQPPFAVRLDRDVLSVSKKGGMIETEFTTRSAAKKAFDRKVFGTEYF